MFNSRLLRADWKLMAAVLILVVIGLTMVYSATRAQLTVQGSSPTSKMATQSVWVVLSLVAFFLVASFEYSRLEQLSLPFYVGVLVLLLLVVVIGSVVRETHRWLSVGPVNIQPAELAKLAVILLLAAYLSSRERDVVDFELLARSLGYALVPSVLILLQPDLGTPVLLVFIWGVICYIFGARLIHLGAFAFAFVMLFAAAWGFGLLQPHQKARLTAFLHAEGADRGQRWQLEQSLIAIGSGHLTGKGLLRGSQSQLSFVPDQETDFIFSVIGEEAGFVGTVSVLILFGIVLWRGLVISALARTVFGRLVAVGIVAMFFFHVAVNIGMTLGMMPVKGLPLPFVSYGGSAMLVNFVAIGILQSIYIDRQSIRFD